ncbi:conjugative transfer signal peptidase TraF [Acidithiobacillus sp.]|uniref:conjugative transfer signal peptidase TraF n=1 Tax=Acidithiobacillus sp. TaxID=1872118 RepID=UPI003D084AA8
MKPALKRASLLAGVSLVVVAPLSALALAHVSLNTTPCMPLGFYQAVAQKPLAVGQTWTVCVPQTWTVYGLHRGYLHPGSACPGGSQALLKKIAALPGQTVTVTKTGVRIDGHLWPMSAPLTRDTAGRPLISDYDVHQIPAGYVWVMGLSPQAWDSRYYGAIPDKDLLNREKAVLIWR